MMGPARGTPARSRSVVVTGASTGLGRAAAIHLADLGYRVFAGVRTGSSGAELSSIASAMSLPAGRLDPVLLDVADTDSVARAGEYVARRCADTGLWGLVNNAGICVCAPLESAPLELVRTQLEVNVLGTLAVSQRLLPLLRASGGRIVNVSSGVANIALPYLGAYSAAQFAKEGLSDSLRRELRPLGVRVSVVQPGAVDTPMWGKIRTTAADVLARAPGEVIEVYRDRFVEFIDSNERRGRGTGTTPADYAAAVAAALGSKRPRARYRVGLDSSCSALARRLFPDRMMDALIGIANSATGPARARQPSRQATS